MTPKRKPAPPADPTPPRVVPPPSGPPPMCPVTGDEDWSAYGEMVRLSKGGEP